jgi:hypothetical protein
MTWSYEIRTYTPAGVPLARLSDFSWLSCTTRVNAPGMLSLGLPGDHAAIAGLSHRSHIELWRKDDDLGLDWYRHFGGLYLHQGRKQAEERTFSAACPGYGWLLGTRTVNWAANTANRSTFTTAKAETIMKTLVSYNAGASATVANGRKREGALTGLTVQADGAHGNTLDWNCWGAVLLETLQKLAAVGGGDFELVKTGTNTFQYQWFTGQRGTDRSASVIFALERGNMGAPEYSYNRLDERTAACVWGKGEGALRAYATRTGADYSAANDCEVTVNASDVDTTAGLQARGDQKLAETRAREAFSFVVLQTPACQLNLHYFVGDLVTVVNPFTGASSVQKVQAATLGLSQDGSPSDTVELRTP